MSTECNAKNPKFIAYVDLLGVLRNYLVLQSDPVNKDNIAVYMTDLDPELYGTSEGWVWKNIFDVAQDTMDAVRSGNTSFFDALAEHGITPVFSDDGSFVRCLIDEMRLLKYFMGKQDIRPYCYSIGEYCEESICLEKNAGGWIVYDGERGNHHHEEVYTDFRDAVHELLYRITDNNEQEQQMKEAFDSVWRVFLANNPSI